MKRTLYVSDLDGTLLNSDSKLSKRTKALINHVIDSGAHFTVATARTPATISKIMRGVEMKLPIIAMTGSVRWKLKSTEYTHAKTIDPAIARQILQIYADCNLPVFIYSLSENGIDVRHYGEMSSLEEQFINERQGTPYKQFISPYDGPHSCAFSDEVLSNVLLFYSMQPTEKHRCVYEKIAELADVNPVFYHDIFGEDVALMEVFSTAASKAEAVKQMAEELGVERIVVFGDNVNDIPMMQIATEAIAVRNAIPEVLHIADQIIGNNNTDDVAKWIVADMLK